MARPLRIEYEGAWYHVMNRGAGRKAVFKTDEHRQYFLSLLSDVSERFDAEIHAYCLMDNHYHLMLRTPRGNLQRIMRHVNGVYTQYFNRTERRDGPLFRGRYKAIVVDADSYWLELSRYIHRNPLQARIVKRLERYRWSSYPAYAGHAEQPDWLMTKTILSAIGKRQSHARYKVFVAGDTDKALTAFYTGSKQSTVLGDDEFRGFVMKSISQHVDIPESRTQQSKPTVEKILRGVEHYYDVPSEVLLKSTRGRGVLTPARSLAMYLCQEKAELTLAEIANVFGLASYASAGATIRNLRKRIDEDKELAKDLDYILQVLTP